jgi:hypothetical protein
MFDMQSTRGGFLTTEQVRRFPMFRFYFDLFAIVFVIGVMGCLIRFLIRRLDQERALTHELKSKILVKIEETADIDRAHTLAWAGQQFTAGEAWERKKKGYWMESVKEASKLWSPE